MYKINLKRKSKTGKAIRGLMTIPFDLLQLKEGEQAFVADTLENADFIIPAGTYKLDRTWSPKFKKFMPELLNVPDRAGIRIHCGTKPEHSTGCILVAPIALESVKAFINRIKKYTDEEICIEITESDPA